MFYNKVKALAGALCVCAVAGTLLAGCGGEKHPAGKASEEVTRVGMLVNLNVSEQQYTSIIRAAEKRAGMKPSVVTYYDNMASMMMGLESKSVDEISVYQCMADYMTSANPKLVPVDYTKVKLEDSFCCAVRENDKELLELLNKGIESMKEDGSLDALTEQYIKNAKGSKTMPAVPLTKIEGAETIKIGFTGDLPPIDLTLADGSPAGFNTAVLSELGKRMGRNIELVPITSGSRATALESRTIDVVFWAVVPAENVANPRPADIDRPKGLVMTKPYFTDKITHVALKK